VDIEGVRKFSDPIVSQNILLHGEIFRNIRPAFTTTVYAFLNPGRPSAARDFFCLKYTAIEKSFDQLEHLFLSVIYIDLLCISITAKTTLWISLCLQSNPDSRHSRN
jgi:hypothetical protein